MDQKTTLRDYLSEATNYLYPSPSPEHQAKEREKLIEFCEANGLSEKFLELIGNDQAWCDLAKRTTVQYFVDVPKHMSSKDRERLPEIKLIACELGTVPAIKVVNTTYI